MVSSAYSISIPEPVMPGKLEQLAQIDTPDGVVSAYWIRESRQVVLQHDDNWYIQTDGNVVASLEEILRPHGQIRMNNLFFFEVPGHGKLQDEKTHAAFYECDWSDYACDRIAIQANLTYLSS